MSFTITFTLWDSWWVIPMLFYIMWVLYVFTMRVRDKWKELPLASKALAFLPATYAWIMDILLNVVIVTVLAREWPREITMTKRFHRWQLSPNSRPTRARRGKWMCENLLNPFDKDHC